MAAFLFLYFLRVGRGGGVVISKLEILGSCETRNGAYLLIVLDEEADPLGEDSLCGIIG